MQNNIFLFIIIISVSLLSCDNSSRTGLKPKSQVSHKNISHKLVSVCELPNSLKKSIETFLNKKCHNITKKHLVKITKIKLQNISDTLSENKKINTYLTNLEKLDLSHNPNLVELPNFVYNLTNLKELNISHTGIRNFSDKLCRLNKLTTLKASHNFYEGREIPIAVFCLTKLKVLDMSHSRIRYIDEYIYYLKYLEEVYLQYNDLVMLPLTLQLLPKISVLDLSYNNFKYPSVNALHNCKESKDLSQQQACKKRFIDTIACEDGYKLPFKRGRGFRERFTEMTGMPHQHTYYNHLDNKCYNHWLHSYVSFYDPAKKYLFHLTENGKTMREYRLAVSTITTYSPHARACGFESKGISIRRFGLLKSMKHFIFPKDTRYLIATYEFKPEQYRGHQWLQPKSCFPIDYDTSIPTSTQLGPWVKALPGVEKAIFKNYPNRMNCKHWMDARCEYYTTDEHIPGFIPMEYAYLGAHSMGLPLKSHITNYSAYKNRKLVKDFWKAWRAEEPSKIKPEVQRLQLMINLEKRVDFFHDPK